MPAAIVLPELGVGEESIRVSSWLAEIGDPLERGDRIVEVLVRGVTFDVHSPASGILVEIRAPVKTAVRSGEILGWMATEGDIRGAGAESL